MAMVKKHHAGRVNEPDVYLYGEDIYGVHSIEYGPVPEQATYYAFALRHGHGAFAPFSEVEAYANPREIPVVPVLFNGRFQSVAELRAFVERAHAEPRCLVVSGKGSCCGWPEVSPVRDFSNNVCKSVRPRPRADRRTLEPELETLPNCTLNRPGSPGG